MYSHLARCMYMIESVVVHENSQHGQGGGGTPVPHHDQVCLCVCVCVLNSWLLTAKDVRVYAERLRLFERGDGVSEFSHVKRGGSASSPRAFSYALPMRNAITS